MEIVKPVLAIDGDPFRLIGDARVRVSLARPRLRSNPCPTVLIEDEAINAGN